MTTITCSCKCSEQTAKITRKKNQQNKYMLRSEWSVCIKTFDSLANRKECCGKCVCVCVRIFIELQFVITKYYSGCLTIATSNYFSISVIHDIECVLCIWREKRYFLRKSTRNIQTRRLASIPVWNRNINPFFFSTLHDVMYRSVEGNMYMHYKHWKMI